MDAATNPDTDIITGDYPLAIHEAGHAVVAHLVGIAIDHVTIRAPRGGGYSKPVRNPTAAAGDRLWAGAKAIRRKLVWGRFGDGFRSKEGWLLRKGSKRRCWKFDGRTVKPSADNCGAVTTHGTPAPELGRRADALERQARAKWRAARARTSAEDRIQDLMHTLGGPVADSVFFDVPFEDPRWRKSTKEEVEEARAQGRPTAIYGCAITWSGNVTARGDFLAIREALKHIDLDGGTWKEAREYYRHKVEQLVRQHRTPIERVAKALVRHKTLNGAELAKLIGAGRDA